MLTSRRAVWPALTGSSDLEGGVLAPGPPGPTLWTTVLCSRPFPPRIAGEAEFNSHLLRLIVPSLGDSCSKNSLGLIINQDEMRMTGCERQTQPGSSAESRALSAHRMPRARARPLAARATWSRPCGRRGWPLGRGGQGASGPDVWVSRPHSSPRAGRAGLLSEPHGGPRDGQGSSPHPPASTRILHGSHAPRGEEVQRAAGDDAVGGGGRA